MVEEIRTAKAESLKSLESKILLKALKKIEVVDFWSTTFSNITSNFH